VSLIFRLTFFVSILLKDQIFNINEFNGYIEFIVMKWIVLALLVHLGTLFSSPSVAQNPEPSPQNIVVLTSFPESFYSPIEQAFSTQYPEHPIHFINKKTPALMAHLVQQRSPQPDLIWLRSSDAMAQLEQQGFIQQSHTFA
jgi:phosphoglycerate transport regulatory protein PgtC